MAYTRAVQERRSGSHVHDRARLRPAWLSSAGPTRSSTSRPPAPMHFPPAPWAASLFTVTADGQVANLSVSQDRVWDLRFRRLSEP